MARIALPSMLYHVITRGNNREWVFNEPEDFEKYLEICRRYKESHGFKLYNWVLMNNHVHMLLETNEKHPLAKVMQGINLAYTIWFNRKNKKVGHLWQDRYKSFVIERDSYLLECGRYIERNPLRAGIAKEIRLYPWSSYNVYAYGKADGLTDLHVLYENMGSEEKQRQTAYRDYVLSNRDKEEEELKLKMAMGVIGDGGFYHQIQKQLVEARRPKRGRPKLTIK
jgi:putative transposase